MMMLRRFGSLIRTCALFCAALFVQMSSALAASSWTGTLHDLGGNPVGGAVVDQASSASDLFSKGLQLFGSQTTKAPRLLFQYARDCVKKLHIAASARYAVGFIHRQNR
jgi:hypothetical protein